MNFIQSNMFNADWYLAQNPDVATAVDAGLLAAGQHFRLFGNAEGRSPGPLFDTQYYLAANPDVAAAVAQGLMSAYDHFVQFGASENRPPFSLFDPQFYLAHSPDVAAAVAAGTFTAVEHFLMYGHAEARIINPFINLGIYVGVNPDIAAAVTAGNGRFDVISHLLQFGVAEGRDLGNGVNLGIFANDPAFQSAVGSGNTHAALERAGEVAPFLPDFIPVPGWTAPPDTPIPLDFIPPDGMKLVIPPGVIVPPGISLPPSFRPITPPPADGGGAPPAPGNEDNDDHQPPGDGNAGDPPTPGIQDGDDGNLPPQAPTFNVEIIGVAGWRHDPDGPFGEDDTIILAFDVPVELGPTPFSVSAGASLGTGYTVSALSSEPQAHFHALQLGAGASLSAVDVLSVRADQILNASGAIAGTGGSIAMADVKGSFTLGKGVGFPEPFTLLPNIDFQLADAPNFVILSPTTVGGAVNVTGGNASDVFLAFSDALQGNPDPSTDGVSINGGGGLDTLFAIQNAAATRPVSVDGVERIITMQQAVDGNGASIDTTFELDGVQGAQELWALNPGATLTLKSVPGQLELGILPGDAYSGSASALDMRYAANADLQNTQYLDLTVSELDRLTIAKHAPDGNLAKAGFTTLAIQLLGDNRIASFTDDSNPDSGLAHTVKTIQLNPLAQVFAFMFGDITPEGFLEEVDTAPMGLIPGLRLGEVWDGLKIDITPLKGWSANLGPEDIFRFFSNANLNLSEAELEEYTELTIRVADLNSDSGEKIGLSPGHGGRDSDLMIVLPADVEPGAVITVENATLASTSGYTSVPLWNDVIDISGWMGCGCDAGLANHVVSFTIDKGAAQGDDWYVDFSMEIDIDGDLTDTTDDVFTFTLANIAQRTHYNEMLKALDTVNFLKEAGQAWESNENANTTDLMLGVGEGRAIAQLEESGDVYGAFKLENSGPTTVVLSRDEGLEEAALIGLIGILVNEGTLWQDSVFST